MDIKWKNNSKLTIVVVLLLSMLAGIVMCSLYPLFRQKAADYRAEKLKQAPDDDETEIEMDEEFMRFARSAVYAMDYKTTPYYEYDYFTQNYNAGTLNAREQEYLAEMAQTLMDALRNQYETVQDVNNISSYVYGGERNYASGVWGEDLLDIIMDPDSSYKKNFAAGIVLSFDSRGVAWVSDSWGFAYDSGEFEKYINEASVNALLEDNGLDYNYIIGPPEEEDQEAPEAESAQTPEEAPAAADGEAPETESAEETPETPEGGADAADRESYENAADIFRSLPLPSLRNKEFAFAIRDKSVSDYVWNQYLLERNSYIFSGYPIAVAAIAAVMMALALILQNIPPLALRKYRIFRLPTELIAAAWFLGIFLTAEVAVYAGIETMEGELAEAFREIGLGGASAGMELFTLWLCWSVFAFCWYWVMASTLPYLTHPIRTFMELSLCAAVLRWCRALWLKIWHWATDIELDENLTRSIWKVVGLNGLIAAALCCFWFFGVAGAVVYSILLYVLVKKRCAAIQDDYGKLSGAVHAIAAGDINAPMKEDMGLFNPLRDELASIQTGFQKAVQEEVKSRNMKTELITNVSHDLKTPLTAIITYVDLLKKEDITEEERRSYVETLDKKSQRLKALIEDLFEVSKATTDNIVMNYEDVDFVSLIKQVRLENEEKISESTLDFRFRLPEEKCILRLDPQRTFRIIDNLIQNILKYSMPHSRVYIEVTDDGEQVQASFKNMSAEEMNFSPQEITERFVRGDLSRNTEGSGLGLAIAQSFTQLQGGIFAVETDGDLFKVLIGWKRT